MNDNELINTAVSGFTPYQFDSQRLSLMPTAFDRTAVRAEKRMSDTQRRVNELVKLDPTNPMSALITMMGAKQNVALRDELMGLRGQALRGSVSQNKRKKILADIKALDYGDALGVYAREKHGSDLDATLNDPDLMKGLEEIATRKKELSLSDRTQLISDAAKMMKFVHDVRSLGSDNPNDLKLAEEYERTLPMIWDTLKGIHKMTDSQITSAIGKVSPPTSVGVGNPNAVIGGGKGKDVSKVSPIKTTPPTGTTQKDGHVQDWKNILLGNKTEEQSGDPTYVDKILKGIQDNVIVPGYKLVKEGNVKDSLKQFVINSTDWLFGELPRELTDAGWKNTKMRLGKRDVYGDANNLKVGDPLPEMRDVAYNSNTGVYVGERGGRKEPYFVGDTVNGVQKSFETSKEAWEFALTYIPKPAQPPKADPKLDSTIMDSIGTGASGSYGGNEPSKSKGLGAAAEDIPDVINVVSPSMKKRLAEMQKRNPQKYAEIVAKLAKQGKQFGSKMSKPYDPSPPAKQDARTDYEKSTKPWQRTWYGGYIDRGINKIQELNEYVLDNYKKFNFLADTAKDIILTKAHGWSRNRDEGTPHLSPSIFSFEGLGNDEKVVVEDLRLPTKESEIAVARDIVELYRAGEDRIGKEGWKLVTNMVKKVGGLGGDFLKLAFTPPDAEGATLNEINEMGGGNNISTGGNNIGGVGKAGKNYGGFAGQNPVAASVDQFLSNPFVDAMVTAESNGKERAIGYKLVEDKDSGKLVYAKDKNGKKIPASYGLMQVTIPTALSTKWGKELLKGLNPKVKEDKEEIKRILFDPYNNLRISTEFANRLRDQLSKNKYASQFSPLEFDQIVSAAYNYKGENFAKDVLDKYKPTNLRDLLHRAYIPKETRRQIKVVGQVLSKGGR